MAMTTAAVAAAAQPKEVKLYGAWGSAHAAMARNALELKGVRYEYVEEDLERKSETLLLRLNPAHAGKVPVLVVVDDDGGGGGCPLAESLVILEYVDEGSGRSSSTARCRRLSRAAAVLAPTPEERAEAVREMKARMAVMEAGFERDFPSSVVGGPFVHGATPGLLDVILGSCAAGTRAISAMAGEEVVEPDALPHVHASMAAFDERVAGFGTSVPHELLLARLLEREERRRAAASASA
ncbi:hypothetical protein OsJ_20675 [Oryza sativa Japonica Group]|uniref:Glutathione S-transferase n=1 Tax=Oryza sativa subsp. japonica TaxID=39947 RepID=A3B9W0_ORYSJ|nr:hypothetical protein OsJ_20675 [Oryza sativa Japonica Group]